MLLEPKGPGQKYEKVRVEQGKGERERKNILENRISWTSIGNDCKDQNISKKMAGSEIEV